MIAIFLLILSISLVSNWIVSHDAKTRHISTIEGTAYPLVAEASFRGTRYMRYELRIKKGRLTRKLFRFSSERSPRQFTEGRTYRIYYINFYPFDIILSAEEL